MDKRNIELNFIRNKGFCRNFGDDKWRYIVNQYGEQLKNGESVLFESFGNRIDNQITYLIIQKVSEMKYNCITRELENDPKDYTYDCRELDQPEYNPFQKYGRPEHRPLRKC